MEVGQVVGKQSASDGLTFGEGADEIQVLDHLQNASRALALASSALHCLDASGYKLK